MPNTYKHNNQTKSMGKKIHTCEKCKYEQTTSKDKGEVLICTKCRRPQVIK